MLLQGALHCEAVGVDVAVIEDEGSRVEGGGCREGGQPGLGALVRGRVTKFVGGGEGGGTGKGKGGGEGVDSDVGLTEGKRWRGEEGGRGRGGGMSDCKNGG